MCISLLCCCILCCLLFLGFLTFVAFFLQYFVEVGWVFWPVKLVSRITYTVLVEILNHAQPTSQPTNQQGWVYCTSQIISWETHHWNILNILSSMIYVKPYFCTLLPLLLNLFIKQWTHFCTTAAAANSAYPCFVLFSYVFQSRFPLSQVDKIPKPLAKLYWAAGVCMTWTCPCHPLPGLFWLIITP